jgi:hypothetical protein
MVRAHRGFGGVQWPPAAAPTFFSLPYGLLQQLQYGSMSQVRCNGALPAHGLAAPCLHAQLRRLGARC